MIVCSLLVFFVLNYWFLDWANFDLIYETDLIDGSSLTVTDLKTLSHQVNIIFFRNSV
jgi:hypothetical protein